MTQVLPLPDNFVPKTLKDAVCTGDFNLIDQFVDQLEGAALPVGLLESAAEYGHPEVIRYLVKDGSDPNEDGGAPLLTAVDFGQEDAAIALLECGATAEPQKYGCPIRMAAKNGLTKVIKKLLEMGYKIPLGTYKREIFDEQGCPLFEASTNNHKETVELLLANADFSYEDIYLSLYESAAMGFEDVVRVIVEKIKSIDLAGPTFVAAQCGRVSIVDLLIERGGFTKERDEGYADHERIFGVCAHHEDVMESIKTGPNSPAWNDIFSSVLNYKDQLPDRDLAEMAIDFMIALEPEDPADYDQESYEKVLSDNATGVENSRKILRQYALGLKPQSFDRLRDEYYSFTNCSKYLESAVMCDVARSCLNEAWGGIHGWSS